MTEIGSFLEYKKEFFNSKNDEFENLVFFKSGRESLRYLIDYFRIKTIFLPDYFCDEVTSYLAQISGLKIIKYPVGDKFKIKQDKLSRLVTDKKANKDRMALVIVDFFGCRDPNYLEIASWLRKKGVVVISDRTHSVLNEYHDYYDAEFASVRKLFVNLPGAYVRGMGYKGRFKKINLRPFLRALSLKDKYLKNHSQKLKNEFLKKMKIGEESFAIFPQNAQAVKMLELEAVLCLADLDKMRKARKKNYEALRKSVKLNKNFSWFDVGYVKNETPAFALIKCRDHKTRENLKRHLIRNNIYPPVHWPNGTKLSRLLISLPIDHRYTPKDMDYIGLAINNFR